jgi:hypothetical protein
VLITALVERWRQETHTFHLPHGEMTITLQDISVMLGLPVDGEVLVGSTDSNWSELCLQLLGVSPPPNKLDESRLNMKWLQDTFGVLPNDANEVTVQRYTRDKFRAKAISLISFKTVFSCKIVLKIKLLSKIPPTFWDNILSSIRISTLSTSSTTVGFLL